MCIQYRQSRRAVQYLGLILLLLPCRGYSQILNDLFDTGVKAAQSVDLVLLDMTSVSDNEENQIGTELKKKILSTTKVSKTQKYDTRLVLKKLLPYCQRKSLQYEVTVVQDNVYNAYATAGGKVFINTGLLNKLQNVDEVAFVIAHEIAHNELKHCIHRIQYSYQTSKIEPSLATIVQLAYSTYKYPFSKEEERLADEYGFQLMRKAGYKKSGAIDFFTKLEKQEGQWKGTKLKAINDFISTHPTAEERRKQLEKL